MRKGDVAGTQKTLKGDMRPSRKRQFVGRLLGDIRETCEILGRRVRGV